MCEWRESTEKSKWMNIRSSRRDKMQQTQGLGRRGVESLRKVSFDHFYFLND